MISRNKFNLLYCFLLLASVFSFSNCSDDKVVITADNYSLIEEEKFTQILVDCQLAESQVTVMRILQPYYKDSILNYYAGIFETHQVTSADFYFSLQEYSKNPVLLDSLYSNAIAILHEMETNLGEVVIPESKLTTLSRQQLGDIILETPIASMIVADYDYNVLYYKDTLMKYLIANPSGYDSLGFNKPSIEFSFVINSSSKIMFNELKDYLIAKQEKQNGID